MVAAPTEVLMAIRGTTRRVPTSDGGTWDVGVYAGFLLPTTHIEKNCEPPPYA